MGVHDDGTAAFPFEIEAGATVEYAPIQEIEVGVDGALRLAPPLAFQWQSWQAVPVPAARRPVVPIPGKVIPSSIRRASKVKGQRRRPARNARVRRIGHEDPWKQPL